VSVVPDGPLPQILDVETNGSTVTLSFTPIPPGRWTCFEHLASGEKRCLGFLPGDSNNDGTAAPADIIRLIDQLNQAGSPLVLYQCDIDHSESCEASDVIRLIDLLNGTAAFEPWLGRSLPECPQ